MPPVPVAAPDTTPVLILIAVFATFDETPAAIPPPTKAIGAAMAPVAAPTPKVVKN